MAKITLDSSYIDSGWSSKLNSNVIWEQHMDLTQSQRDNLKQERLLNDKSSQAALENATRENNVDILSNAYICAWDEIKTGADIFSTNIEER